MTLVGRSSPMLLRATLTMVPSRNTAPEPMTVATRVHRWREVTAAVSQPGDGPASFPGRLTAMPGPVALVGAGEFLPSMAEFDQGLLASTGRSRPGS